LLSQQVAGDAGIHATAHAKQNALFVSVHASK